MCLKWFWPYLICTNTCMMLKNKTTGEGKFTAFCCVFLSAESCIQTVDLVITMVTRQCDTLLKIHFSLCISCNYLLWMSFDGIWDLNAFAVVQSFLTEVIISLPTSSSSRLQGFVCYHRIFIGTVDKKNKLSQDFEIIGIATSNVNMP